MNGQEVAKRGGTGRLPATLAATPISARLLDAIRATEDPHPDVGLPASYAPDVRDEAARVLASIGGIASQVTEGTMRQWLAMIPHAVRNPPEPERLEGWLGTVFLAIGHLEAGAFTIETQRVALQTFDFFPSAADVYKVVSGPAMAIRRRVQVLRRIADAPTPEGGA